MPAHKQDIPTIIFRQELKALTRLLRVKDLTVLERRVLTLRVRDGRSWGLIQGIMKMTEAEVRALVESAKGKAKAEAPNGRSTADQFDPFQHQEPTVPAGRGPRPLPAPEDNPFQKSKEHHHA